MYWQILYSHPLTHVTINVVLYKLCIWVPIYLFISLYCIHVIRIVKKKSNISFYLFITLYNNMYCIQTYPPAIKIEGVLHSCILHSLPREATAKYWFIIALRHILSWLFIICFKYTITSQTIRENSLCKRTKFQVSKRNKSINYNSWKYINLKRIR